MRREVRDVRTFEPGEPISATRDYVSRSMCGIPKPTSDPIAKLWRERTHGRGRCATQQQKGFRRAMIGLAEIEEMVAEYAEAVQASKERH
jgi:hypothetical protein